MKDPLAVPIVVAVETRGQARAQLTSEDLCSHFHYR